MRCRHPDSRLACDTAFLATQPNRHSCKKKKNRALLAFILNTTFVVSSGAEMPEGDKRRVGSVPQTLRAGNQTNENDPVR